MDLQRLYAGSFIDWEAVAASWSKRTVPSRLLLFAARRYLEEGAGVPDTGRAEMLAPASRRGGEFVDAAVAAELEMVSYGERPPLLHELRAGLEQAAEEAGPLTDSGRWFLARRDALPGTDLPDDPEYLPI